MLRCGDAWRGNILQSSYITGLCYHYYVARICIWHSGALDAYRGHGVEHYGPLLLFVAPFTYKLSGRTHKDQCQMEKEERIEKETFNHLRNSLLIALLLE